MPIHFKTIQIGFSLDDQTVCPLIDRCDDRDDRVTSKRILNFGTL